MKIWPFYSSAAIAAVSRLLAAGESYTTSEHPVIRDLESRFSSDFKLPGHSLFMGSGTAALLAGYYGLNLRPGDEVLAPAYTFHATITPLLALQIRPVLCDVDPVTGLMDLEAARSRLTTRTRALVVTHLWGQPADLMAARQFCDDHGLYLAEDCSHAHGVSQENFRVGERGDFAAFSLGTKKLISGGLGGMLVTRSETIYARAILLTQPRPRAIDLLEGLDSRLLPYARTGLGFNLRGSPLSAVLAMDHLKRFPETVRIKNENLRAVARLFLRYLPSVHVPPIPSDEAGTLYRLPLMAAVGNTPGADLIISELRAVGMRVGRLGSGLQSEAIVDDPEHLLRPKTRVLGSGLFPAVQGLEENGFQLDTRDMYVPWSAERMARLAGGLRALSAVG